LGEVSGEKSAREIPEEGWDKVLKRKRMLEILGCSVYGRGKFAWRVWAGRYFHANKFVV